MGRRKQDSRTRLEKMEAEGQVPNLPYLGPGLRELVEQFFDVGPAKETGMGSVPVDDERLRAWQENTGHELQPWETRMFKRLSAEWIKQKHEAESPSCPPPFGYRLSRADVAKKIDALL